jgi:hypothetical protein
LNTARKKTPNPNAGKKDYTPVYVSIADKPDSIMRGMDNFVAEVQKTESAGDKWRWVPMLIFFVGVGLTAIDGCLFLLGLFRSSLRSAHSALAGGLHPCPQTAEERLARFFPALLRDKGNPAHASRRPQAWFHLPRSSRPDGSHAPHQGGARNKDTQNRTTQHFPTNGFR